jgi:hypothetical protein
MGDDRTNLLHEEEERNVMMFRWLLVEMVAGDNLVVLTHLLLLLGDLFRIDTEIIIEAGNRIVGCELLVDLASVGFEDANVIGNLVGKIGFLLQMCNDIGNVAILGHEHFIGFLFLMSASAVTNRTGHPYLLRDAFWQPGELDGLPLL